MGMDRKGFSAYCYAPETEEFISSHAEVESDADGYFIRVETDAHEGVAQFTLPVARQVLAALALAIKFAESKRPTVPGSNPGCGSNPLVVV